MTSSWTIRGGCWLFSRSPQTCDKMKIRWNLKTNKLFSFFLQLSIIGLFRLNDFLYCTPLYWRKNIPVLPTGQECVHAVASMIEMRDETWTWLLATSGHFGINITLTDLTAMSPGHLVDTTQALSFSFSYCLLCCLFEFPIGGIPSLNTTPEQSCGLEKVSIDVLQSTILSPLFNIPFTFPCIEFVQNLNIKTKTGNGNI